MATQHTRRAHAPRRRANASQQNRRASASQSYGYPNFRASDHSGTKCTGRDSYSAVYLLYGLQVHNASVHASCRWVMNQGLFRYIYTFSLKLYVYMLRVFLARTTSLWGYINTVKRLPEIKLGFDCIYILFSFSFKSQVTLS